MQPALGTTPSKIIAVHLNYRSRALERGQIPAQPSYFLKPPSSLSGPGSPLIRPRGCELMTFEGEIAVVIGEQARGVPREQAWQHVAGVTAANDAGVSDLRYADRGSNLRSKGADGFTPVGPRMLTAAGLDPAALRLRSWVNGELAQDATAADLLFDFDYLIADLSRLITLNPGDILLTGTPAGSSVVKPGDLVEVEVSDGRSSTGRLSNMVADASDDLPAIGAMPRADELARALALGAGQGGSLTGDLRDVLATLSTATLSSQLRRRGVLGATVDGVRPVRPGCTMVGTARTVRYLPLREDLAARHGTGMNAQKRAVESLQPGDVLVIDARQETSAGTIGDILALRAQVRGAAGIVTDGALRDSAAVASLDIPVYSAAAHPAVLGRRHVPWETDVPVACGGALIQPGDILVGDADGVVVVPASLAGEIAADTVEQERQERFISERVRAGASIDGLYPLGQGWQPTYEEWSGATR